MKFNEYYFGIIDEYSQKGSCMYWAETYAKQLIKNKTKNALIHEGYVIFSMLADKTKLKSPKFQHTWVTVNNKIIDETLDQFNGVNGWDISTVKYIKYKKYTPEEYLKLCEKYPVDPIKIN